MTTTKEPNMTASTRIRAARQEAEIRLIHEALAGPLGAVEKLRLQERLAELTLESVQ